MSLINIGLGSSYAAQAGAGLEAQNQFAEIKLRAERKAGEFLQGLERKAGARTDLTSVHGGTRLKETMRDAGISKITAFRWQQAATVPEDEFEAHTTHPDTHGAISQA